MFLSRHPALSVEPLASLDVHQVLAQSMVLRQAAQAGNLHSLLRGKKLGLVCKESESVDALFFRDSATELGAHVSHVWPNLGMASPQKLQRTALLLSQLYDALEFQDVPADIVAQIDEAADVPIYLGLACDSHPSATLVHLLDTTRSPKDNRRLILQAVLMHTLN